MTAEQVLNAIGRNPFAGLLLLFVLAALWYRVARKWEDD